MYITFIWVISYGSLENYVSTQWTGRRNNPGSKNRCKAWVWKVIRGLARPLPSITLLQILERVNSSKILISWLTVTSGGGSELPIRWLAGSIPINHQGIAATCWFKISQKERQPFQFWAVGIPHLPATYFKSSVHHAVNYVFMMAISNTTQKNCFHLLF